MLSLHEWNGVLVVAVCLAAGVVALIAWRRPFGDRVVTNALALAPTLIAAQIGLGLLLIADDRRAPERMHYAYGFFALIALLAPFLYAPGEPRARLLWFGIAALVAGLLAGRAYMTA